MLARVWEEIHNEVFDIPFDNYSDIEKTLRYLPGQNHITILSDSGIVVDMFCIENLG